QIEPGKRHERVAGDFAGTELEPIARSVDTLLERLEGFVAREQSFTEAASHELRTPLAVVQGAIELLGEQTRAQPGTRKPIARIERAVREMTEYTEALLTLAREDRLPDPGDGHCDVPALLARVSDDLQSIAGERRIHVDCEPATRLRIAAPDSVVTMVVSNLLRNALQHGRGERIECRLRGRTLSIVNEGEIAPAAHERLFERHFTTFDGGHGMGLYIARQVCERYGWDLILASSGGSTRASVTF
ncbi:MAG TPA: HAMP domain-containing sensor histidine kinase, partial [Steroidobacteraceae bacterium]|nr:HAMP domain-containing sensor histidine kinase [Steroidobacteraceae bacterium]